MSEPLSKLEIEDVLSSIRRLVSDDLRPVSRVQTPKPDVVVAPQHGAIPVPAAEKLLLTPALRVVRAAEAEQEPKAQVQAEPVQTDVEPAAELTMDVAEAGFVDAPPDPKTAAGFEQVIDPFEDGDGTETSVMAPLVLRAPEPDLARVVTRLGSEVVEEDWESPLGDTEAWPGAGWTDAGEATSGADDLVMRFVHRPRVTEAYVMDQGSFEDEGAVAAIPGFADIEDGMTEDVATPGTVPDALPPDDRVAHIDDAVIMPPPMAAMAPDVDDTAWADQAEAEVIADLAQDIEDSMAMGSGPGFAADGGEVVFDEAVLRDLVRDLIREELAGSLGERITRNVRKLVRAEINRALAVQELG